VSDILINITPVETRIAFVENGMLQEIYVERAQKRGLVGNIYRGKVVRIMTGMQAAFVDIGLAKAAFLHAADIAGASIDAPIHTLLHEGQTITVQVMKDPIATKGARVTSELSLPSRYVVYTPINSHIGVSQRIVDEAQKEKLRVSVEQAAREQKMAGGFIVRTAAEEATDTDIKDDIIFLNKLWQQVSESEKKTSPPGLVYEDLPLHLRILRDIIKDNLDKIIIDDEAAFKQAALFLDNFMPSIKQRLDLYVKDRPLFDVYNIEDEIQKSLERKVVLKSGGYLVIDQTESMTTIDVNTGAFVGSRTLQETILKTNIEAATSLARQLRIRNLGGIIIIDFIDMQDPEDRRHVLRLLEKALEKDSAKTNITGVSELGLVVMTRKRTRESLGQLLCEPCTACHGKGIMKTAETICHEIMREVLRLSRSCESHQCRVVAAQTVVERFLDEEAGYVAEVEKAIGRTISLQVERLYMQEQYDVILS
jgi:ribonuclease G